MICDACAWADYGDLEYSRIVAGDDRPGANGLLLRVEQCSDNLSFSPRASGSFIADAEYAAYPFQTLINEERNNPMLGAMAISLLWLLIYAICFAGVVYLVIYGIKTFISPIPALVEKGIWFIVLILILIGVLTVLLGGGVVEHPNFLQR